MCVHEEFVLALSYPSLSPVASAPTKLMAFQESTTKIQVSWTMPTPLGDTTGYRIYYIGGSSGSVDVSGSSTNSPTLTRLLNGASYNLSIVGKSKHILSDHVYYPNSIPLGELLQLTCVMTNKPDRWSLNIIFKPSAWPTERDCELNNSHQNLPLLECSQWLSGGQL